MTFKYNEVGLTDPMEKARQMGISCQQAYYGPGENNRVVLITYGLDGREEHPIEEEVYAVSVPGHYLVSWDGDFCRTYFTRSKKLAEALQRAINIAMDAESLIRFLIRTGGAS